MGQFFLHDLVFINMNYSEPMPIEFPSDDPFSGGKASIPFWRAAYELDLLFRFVVHASKYSSSSHRYVEGTGTNSSNPRQYRNAVTQWIDLNTVYGSSDAAAAILRANDGTGRLRMGDDGVSLPIATAEDLKVIPMQTSFDSSMPSSKQLYLAGDIRANQNYMLLAFHTLFAREHNRLLSFNYFFFCCFAFNIF